MLLLSLALAGGCPPPLDYRTWRPAKGQRWDFAQDARGGGRVEMIGAEHLRDPAAPQFARIAAAFAQSKPTLALFEGPDRGIGTDADDTIRTRGESGYLRWLARQANVPTRSLEPDPAMQVSALQRDFTGDRIMLFFVLREAARLRDREGVTGTALDTAVTTLLQRTAALAKKTGLATSIADIATLESAAVREWPRMDWRTIPAGWFAPGEGVAAARFLPAINTALSELRDRHLVAIAGDAARRGERVFVVVGRNHVPMVAPSLACELHDEGR